MQTQKHLFSLPEDITFLNNAYMSPNLKAVEQAGIESVSRKNNPINVTPDDFFEPVHEIRALFAQLIDCPKERVALAPSVSYGLANAAKNAGLNVGDEIIIVGEQFPSNYYCWETAAKEKGAFITTVSAKESVANRGEDWNERILGAIGPLTRVVAMPMVHWADGTLFDLKAIRKKTKQHNCLLIIDGSQSVGAFPFSVKEIQPDFLATVSYKWLLGPYGTAYCYYGPAFDNGSPIEHSWSNRKDSNNFANLVNYNPNYAAGARRYEVGQTSNFISIPMMKVALTQILEWGVENIQNHCQSINQSVIAELNSLGFKIEDAHFRSDHLFGIRLPKEVEMEQVQTALKEQNIHVSYRGNAIRVSPYLYSSKEDLEHLCETLKKCIPVLI